MRPIVTFWTGPRLRDLDHLCVRSWLEMGHPVKFFSYEPVANVPPGVIMRDAAEIMDRRQLYDDAPELKAKPFTIANLFRLALLMKGEGVWCDSDYAMLRPLPEFDDFLVGREQNGKLCNAILWFPPEHPLMPTVIEHYLSRGMPPWSYAKPRWKRFLRRISGGGASLDDYPKHQWGRHALEYYVDRAGLGDKAKGYKAFYYPVIYDDYLFVQKPYQHIVDDPEVYGIHIFYKKKHSYDAAGPGSFVGWLKERYGETLEPAA